MPFYDANPDDPEAPVPLPDYQGRYAVGDAVEYVNPKAPPLPGPLTVTEIWAWLPVGTTPGWATVILNDGDYEVDADNLRRVAT